MKTLNRLHKLLAIFSRVKQLCKILPFGDALKLVFSYFFLSQNRQIRVNPKDCKHSILIRNNRIDERTLLGTFRDQYHLPPSKFDLPPNSIILDLGANIGSTCYHLINLYPDATILGYELDEENANLAIINTNIFENVNIINKGIWHKNMTCKYSAKENVNAYKVDQSNPSSINIKTAELISIEEVIHKFDKIDFLKMDIEGAEINILKETNLEWLKKVNSLNIEFHLDESQDLLYYREMFERLGFTLNTETTHWSSIIGYRS